MSLRVWLPLTKDLRNQGLDEVEVTNNGAAYSATGGKLGGCYSFDGNDDSIRLDGDAIPALQQNDFSICFWVYNNDSGGRSIYIATTPASDWGFSIEKTASEQLRVYWQGNPDYVASNYLIPVQEWCHIAMIIKNGNCYCYKNGEKVAERTNGDMTPAKLSRTWVYAQLGRDTRTGTTVLKGKMNDFRWYNHALSPMEVKQISQGLVLHYPLNRGGWGQENLVHNSNQFRVGGHASGVTPSVEEDGTYKVVAASGNSNYSSSWWKEMTGIEDEFLEGEDFTVSFWIKSSDANKTNPPTIYLKSGMGYYSMKGTVSANYSQVYYTGTWKKANSLEPHLGWSGLVGTYYICQWKIEKGILPTPWCPNSSDDLATTMGMNDGIEYDCSGFCNNGTRTGTFTWTSNTSKYLVSQAFNGNNYIGLVPPDSEIQTVTFWVKWSTIPSSQTIGFIDDGSGLAFGLSYGNIIVSCQIAGAASCYNASVLSANNWYHIVVIKTGATTRKLYINAVEQTANSSTNYWSYINNELQIGKRKNTGEGIIGWMSDFRMYATALSASDVLSLYQNSAYIDSSGNVYGAVHTEA